MCHRPPVSESARYAFADLVEVILIRLPTLSYWYVIS